MKVIVSGITRMENQEKVKWLIILENGKTTYWHENGNKARGS